MKKALQTLGRLVLLAGVVFLTTPCACGSFASVMGEGFTMAACSPGQANSCCQSDKGAGSIHSDMGHSAVQVKADFTTPALAALPPVFTVPSLGRAALLSALPVVSFQYPPGSPTPLRI